MSKRSKPAVKYRGLSFPVPLLEEVKSYISNKPEYRSVSEFIRGAIRAKLREEYMLNDNGTKGDDDDIDMSKIKCKFIRNVRGTITEEEYDLEELISGVIDYEDMNEYKLIEIKLQ